MSQPDNQAEAIVDALLGMPREERAAYLEQACGSDAQKRLLVEGMLKAHEQAEALIQLRGSPARKTIAVAPLPISEKPGDRIGRYKLLQQIGEGGCGVVYLAEQSEPVRRRVALKVIKPGMDTRQVIARFEAERQALAMMDHPNIAKVFDGGVTETGRPFFVMELVKGLPITRYCDEHKLDTVRRLELFVQVCEAIQHAHQKEIIHRDIKPSNILVFERDGTAVPKVIDFGIAKAISGQSLTDKTLFTAFDQFIGTPTYMSPEQAELTMVEIDHRSDVYSLGVLLYELLTGRTPFDPKRLGQAAIEEVRRIIREEDPVKPSTRLSVLERSEQTTVARARQCEPPKLIGLILGDLDWIVMKTLEKDRTRRYETAHGLAADIRRYLRHEPIQARPPSKLYRIGKLVRRHKLAFGAATVVASALLVVVLVLTYAFNLARNGKTVAAPDVKRIAVLSFTNASPDGVPNYVCDSLTYELINSLQTVPGLSAFGAAANQSVDQIRNVLGPFKALLVEGRVEETNGKIVIGARLSDTVTGRKLVAASYECDSTNLLGIPNDLTLQIAKSLITPLSTDLRNRIKRLPTQNPQAYDNYLQARLELQQRFSRPGLANDSIPKLQQAVDLDPEFALGFADLSRAYVVRYFYLKPEEVGALELKAAKAFERALELGPDLAEAHFAKGFYYWTPSQHWDVGKAVKEDSLALRLNPNSLEVSDQLTLIYLHIGLFKKAGELTTQSIMSNPLNPLTRFLEANAYFWQGKDEEAVTVWESVPNAIEGNFIMNSYRIVALINLGKTEKAQSLIQAAMANDTSLLFTSVRALLLAKQGDKPGAIEQIDAALAKRGRFGHFHHALYNIAAAQALLNEPDKAVKSLVEAANDGFPCYPFFIADSNLNSLREREDFKAFLADQKQKHEHFKTQFGADMFSGR